MPRLKIKHLLISSALICLCLGQVLFADQPAEKIRQRLEQLFIWRVSDRLQLTPTDESRFTAEYKKLCDERSKLGQQLDTALDKIEQDKDDKKTAAKSLGEYESTLKKYNQLQSRELEVMTKIFDTRKMVEYLLLKREMTQKYKDVLTQSPTRTQADNRPLKEPQVIQEK